MWQPFASVRPVRGTSYSFTLTLDAGSYLFRVIVDATGRIAAGATSFFHVIVTPAPPSPVVTTPHRRSAYPATLTTRC